MKILMSEISSYFGIVNMEMNRHLKFCIRDSAIVQHAIASDATPHHHGFRGGKAHNLYSSSSSSSPSSPPSAAFIFLRRTRPGRPPPNGEVRAKSICFWESRRTMKDGTLTICLPTLYTQRYKHLPLPKSTQTVVTYRMCLCLMRTRAWWIDLARPSL